MTRRWEIPPTAGLPLRWRDLLNLSGDLAPALARQFSLPLPALTCSGTAALIIALRVLQQRMPGRTRLIVPAYTCPLVALAAHYCPPLRVVPCDLQPDSIDLDERQLALAARVRESDIRQRPWFKAASRNWRQTASRWATPVTTRMCLPASGSSRSYVDLSRVLPEPVRS